MGTATRIEIADNILTLTLARPDKLNAYNPVMQAEMIAAFDMADADDAVRAVIVTGEGRAFCAGADLSGGGATFDYGGDSEWRSEATPVQADGSVDYTHPSIRDGGGMLALRIFRSKKPVIGAINGAAVGVGATMTLPMDVRIASDAARYGFVFARRGITPEAASSWFLPRIVGIANALDLCFSGRIIGADEALALGLVRSVHAPDDLLPAARAIARNYIEATAPVSIALTRQMLWRMLGAAHPMEAHRLDSRTIWARGASADAAEGVNSFLEKRPAVFADRVSSDMPHFAPWMDDPDWG
ncbi:crotonase/enoyl-CoA hydratase family protein [Sphingomonas sp. KC8]|uniref:crotonase/enoyl-CoA hydratase family protein n=1 Tax=Sphingomonas sp. KC8 TaxID=1030157 RepID=UPI000248BB80|nr:crotonase/enoyl-CoA hydratase family protein [Sphingomonas sp. KC8]ARS25951.1 enoyl-CoA hydratase [Sphingomonas sp. KC8]